MNAVWQLLSSRLSGAAPSISSPVWLSAQIKTTKTLTGLRECREECWRGSGRRTDPTCCCCCCCCAHGQADALPNVFFRLAVPGFPSHHNGHCSQLQLPVQANRGALKVGRASSLHLDTLFIACVEINSTPFLCFPLVLDKLTLADETQVSLVSMRSKTRSHVITRSSCTCA